MTELEWDKVRELTQICKSGQVWCIHCYSTCEKVLQFLREAAAGGDLNRGRLRQTDLPWIVFLKWKICRWMKDNCREQSSCIWLFKYQLPIGQIFKGPSPRVSPPLPHTLCKISFWRLNLFSFHWLCLCSELKYLIQPLWAKVQMNTLT